MTDTKPVEPAVAMAYALRELADLVESGVWPVEVQETEWGRTVTFGVMPSRDEIEMSHLQVPSVAIRLRVHGTHNPTNSPPSLYIAHRKRHQHGGHGYFPAGSWWCAACRELHLRGERCDEEDDAPC